MGLETGNSSGGLLAPDLSLEKVRRLAEELVLPGRLVLRALYAALELTTNLLARVLGSSLVRRHFHLMLSGLVLFGPLLSLWASKYSIFANNHHYLYRKFLKSTWGWTWTFTGSFIFLFSLSVHRSLSLSLRHLSRMAVVACLWWVCRHLLTLLEDAAGTCYEPVAAKQDTHQSSSPPGAPLGLPLLLLHEGQTKASCLRANMVWRGYEVSQDVLILCLCCLLLVEELSVFGAHIARAAAAVGPLQTRLPGAPLRLIFLLCVVLLSVWVFLLLCLLTYFPKFPSQQLGGALGYLGWKGLYQGWYRLKPRWGCPGMPGDGLLTSTDTDKNTQNNITH